MKLRLVKKEGKMLLLCNDGSIAETNERMLRLLFISYKDIDSFAGQQGMWQTQFDSMDLYPGTTIAYVNDSYHLCLVENPFISLMQNLSDDEYITLHEYAVLHGKNDNRIKLLCREKRIPGAIKKAGKWFMPRHAPYPQDARFSGIEK